MGRELHPKQKSILSVQVNLNEHMLLTTDPLGFGVYGFAVCVLH